MQQWTSFNSIISFNLINNFYLFSVFFCFLLLFSIARYLLMMNVCICCVAYVVLQTYILYCPQNNASGDRNILHLTNFISDGFFSRWPRLVRFVSKKGLNIPPFKRNESGRTINIAILASVFIFNIVPRRLIWDMDECPFKIKKSIR